MVTTTAPAEASLPPFTNQRAICAGCGRRGGIRVHFDRDCARAKGDHFHRLCPCGQEQIEGCQEDSLDAPLSGDARAHGTSDARARSVSLQSWMSMHRCELGLAAAALVASGAAALAVRDRLRR
jgi:hypothetical protein